ncbi:cytochrome c [Aquisalimonas sp.]|uniref:c-type cytochrome n=1 Tax=unclassified Aquisalimonas TaxID=2644645 RepID=UPI0025C349D6|nr:cytochrome c [Aquisalimonas sp.]
MMKSSSLSAIGALALMISAPALAIDRGDPSVGQQIAEDQCIACHAVDGSQSNPEWPKLSGQYADYLFRSLQQYQDGTRENAVMQGQVEGLSTQDLRDLASYYSRLDGDLYVPRKR